MLSAVIHACATSFCIEMCVEQLLLHPGTQQSPDVLVWLNEKMNLLHGSPRAVLLLLLGWGRLTCDEESEAVSGG